MSRASREWKESCKYANRLTNGTSWPKKDMTLRSYMAMKRENQQWLKIDAPNLMKKRNMVYVPPIMVRISHDGIEHTVVLKDGDMKSEITVSIGS